MTTTHERIDKDIKKNVSKLLKTSIDGIKSEVDQKVQMHVQSYMHELKDLVTPGTPAFDKESAYAIKQITNQIKTGLVELLRKDIKK